MLLTSDSKDITVIHVGEGPKDLVDGNDEEKGGEGDTCAHCINKCDVMRRLRKGESWERNGGAQAAPKSSVHYIGDAQHTLGRFGLRVGHVFELHTAGLKFNFHNYGIWL